MGHCKEDVVSMQLVSPYKDENEQLVIQVAEVYGLCVETVLKMLGEISRGLMDDKASYRSEDYGEGYAQGKKDLARMVMILLSDGGKWEEIKARVDPQLPIRAKANSDSYR